MWALTLCLSIQSSEETDSLFYITVNTIKPVCVIDTQEAQCFRLLLQRRKCPLIRSTESSTLDLSIFRCYSSGFCIKSIHTFFRGSSAWIAALNLEVPIHHYIVWTYLRLHLYASRIDQLECSSSKTTLHSNSFFNITTNLFVAILFITPVIRLIYLTQVSLLLEKT